MKFNLFNMHFRSITNCMLIFTRFTEEKTSRHSMKIIIITSCWRAKCSIRFIQIETMTHIHARARIRKKEQHSSRIHCSDNYTESVSIVGVEGEMIVW